LILKDLLAERQGVSSNLRIPNVFASFSLRGNAMVMFSERRCNKKMANKKVALVRKCKTPDGWRYYPAVMSANGKVKPDAVLVDGVEVAYPVGHYELRSYAGPKLVYTRVRGNATDALAALKQAQKTANAVAIAGDAGVKVVLDPVRIPLRDAHSRFVEAAVARGANEAAEIYQRTLEDFLRTCSKTYADELTHADILKFHAEMRKGRPAAVKQKGTAAAKQKGLSDRTIFNRHMNLRAFLIFLGFRDDALKKLAGEKPPRFEKTMPKIYEPENLTTFFKSLTSEYDKLLFKLLLMTGLREREAMHVEWVDISWAHRLLQVRSKPQWDHRIKDAEERELPVPKELIKMLQRYRTQHPNDRLVFGKLGGTVDEPDGHLLRRLKALVRDAGLNCGTCSPCKSSKECGSYTLHTFRRSYITTLLRNGTDLRTCMVLSGHSDIESVMRYLRPAGTKEMMARVDSIKWH
jgi:integrase